MPAVRYTASYESSLIRGDQDPLPWNLHEEIAALLSPQHHLLDVGCGTAFKTVRLAARTSRTVGLEPNLFMRAKAAANTAVADVTLDVVGGVAEHLPFTSDVFDMVTVMLAPHDTAEIARVLRPGGCVVMEKLGEQDKLNIKHEFDPDDQGPRGQLVELAAGERAHMLTSELTRHFGRVEVRQGFWRTYYTLEGLTLLLEQTPIVRGFGRAGDHQVLKRLQELYSTDRGIETTQHRVLVRAWK